MIGWLSDRIAGAFVRSGAIVEEDREVYVYGLDVLLSTTASTLVIAVLGILAGRAPETILFLSAFIVLRSVAGGYHASTHFRCFLVMLGAFSAAIALTFTLEGLPGVWFSASAAVFALAAVLALAPVPHENKPVTGPEIKRFRKLSLAAAAAEATAVALLLAVGLDRLAVACSAGMLASSASLIAAAFVSKKYKHVQ